jgi:probable rRNA maturation factor
MALEIEAVLESEGWNAVFDPEELAQICIKAAAKKRRSMPKKDSEVCVIFCDDKKMQELNRDWRKMDKPTNVLSFPAPRLPGPTPVIALGDIFLGLETVQREAMEQDKSFRDHAAHMIVHGFLHLIGYDHENDTDAEEMEGEEIRVLATLGISNPYHGDWRPENAG